MEQVVCSRRLLHCEVGCLTLFDDFEVLALQQTAACRDVKRQTHQGLLRDLHLFSFLDRCSTS